VVLYLSARDDLGIPKSLKRRYKVRLVKRSLTSKILIMVVTVFISFGNDCRSDELLHSVFSSLLDDLFIFI